MKQSDPYPPLNSMAFTHSVAFLFLISALSASAVPSLSPPTRAPPLPPRSPLPPVVKPIATYNTALKGASVSPPVSTTSSGAAQLYIYNSTYALITWQFTKVKNVYAAALWTPGPKNGTVLATVFSSMLQNAPQPVTGTFKTALVSGWRGLYRFCLWLALTCPC